MSYTVSDLEGFNKILKGSNGLKTFITKTGEEEVKNLLYELINDKIKVENKNRKKRVIKFINFYKTKYSSEINTVKDLLDIINKEEDFKNCVSACFNSKKQLHVSVIDFYIKDLKEYFNLFAPTTTINELINISK